MVAVTARPVGRRKTRQSSGPGVRRRCARRRAITSASRAGRSVVHHSLRRWSSAADFAPLHASPMAAVAVGHDLAPPQCSLRLSPSGGYARRYDHLVMTSRRSTPNCTGSNKPRAGGRRRKSRRGWPGCGRRAGVVPCRREVDSCFFWSSYRSGSRYYAKSAADSPHSSRAECKAVTAFCLAGRCADRSAAADELTLFRLRYE